MSFWVEISPVAQKLLDKLDHSVVIHLVTRIERLKTNPLRQGKPLEKGYRELRYEKFRIYYDIDNDAVVIKKITYEGTVNIRVIGNKKSQKKDIGKLKHTPNH